MTAKEFDQIIWFKGIEVKYWGKIWKVVWVNFRTRKIGILGDFGYVNTVSHLKCTVEEPE